MLSIIAAVSDNNVIGKNNKLIWHLPKDLKHFKNLTMDHTIIMGRKTFESLGKILPNRKHIILTKDKDYKIEDEHVQIVNDIEKLNDYINPNEENFVIGGAIIYKQLFQKTDKMYITKIHENFAGDAYFPIINEQEWEKIERMTEIKNEKNPYNYEFITYIRKKVL